MRGSRWVASAALVAGGALAWSLVEARSYVLRRVEVPVLPAGSRPVRILHLSDLHLTPSQRDKVAWVRDLASEPLDAVITTGDNLAHLEAVPTALEALEPLGSLPGAFVFGSNDYHGPRPKNPLTYLVRPTTLKESQAALPVEDLRAGLRGFGWVDLNNARGELEAAGARFELVGVDDPHIGLDAMPAPAARGEGVTARLGVAHAPYTRILDQMSADGADLILAGHTHGGQVCVPFYGALVTNCDLDTARASGLHGWPGVRPDSGGSGAFVHVSAGLGTSPYTPIRLACRPEATVLTLVPRA
ncbi:metallophosphoesterase [Demequina pelophila]|uniref:metallophosphoesterase n=1 Tax=Demequina pelophila TaxID=1638984 RepID=UPI0007807E18|nr:metallophosphoesterase [Demequina pelophila]